LLTNCEVAIKDFVPALKAALAKKLVKDFGLSQSESARRLKLTQAAVNKYLSGKYSAQLKRLEKSREVRKLAERLAPKLAGVGRRGCAVCGSSGGCGFSKAPILEKIR